MTTTRIQVQPSRQRIAEYVDSQGQVTNLAYRWDGRPHYPLIQVMKVLRAKTGADTDEVYARWFLNFDTYAEREKDVRWDDPPEVVREVYIAYLRSLGVQVTQKGRMHVIYFDPGAGDPQDDEQGWSPRRLSKTTLRLQHEALQSIYTKAKKLGIYPHKNSPMSRV